MSAITSDTNTPGTEANIDVDALVDHGQCIVNDVRLHYVEAGPDDGDLVICLHGFPEFWYSWRHQLPALVDAGYRVVAPDMRGYNRSEKPPDVRAYRLEELTADVAGLVSHCEADRAHLLGHDWGGVVSWATAYTYPAHVETLTVMNAPHPIKYTRELTVEQFVRSWYALAFQLPWAPERLLAARDFAALEAVFTDDPIAEDAFTDADIERYKEAFRKPGTPEAAINYYRALLRYTARSELVGALPLVGDCLARPVPRVTAPTLVLWGERDVALSTSQLEGLEAYVDDVEIVRFPDASHWVNLDRPTAVTETVLEFLASDRR